MPVQSLWMSTMFLFGAGASYGSGDCSPYCPPLERDLFPELQRWGGVASTVENPLREKFIVDFEKGMEEFYRHRNTDTTAFLREMAGYFAQFKPGPKNYYGKLARIVAQASGTVVLATTNYEMLIELALDGAGQGVAYGRPPQSIRKGIPLLKIHGSCNFLPDQERARIEGSSFCDSWLQEQDGTPVEDLERHIYDGPAKSFRQ
jgi:hypothetical protein